MYIIEVYYEYDVIVADNLGELIDDTNHQCTKGWEPVGGLVINNAIWIEDETGNYPGQTVYYQTMRRPVRTVDPSKKEVIHKQEGK